MGLRTKAYLVGAILTSYSSFAAALGLGEITIDSALNQPLDAEIQLLHVRDLTKREILISLASSEDFTRASVDRHYFLQDLNFEVDLNSPGGPVVHVTSKKPVREPFINFLLTAQWPSGKLLREYTLLVDLPVFSGAKTAPVEAAQREQSPSVSRQPTTRPRTQVNRPSANAGDEYGPVSSSDTLWSIAAQVRPDTSVSVQQTMLALQRLNPQAFINGNINLLRRGQVLRVPDRQDIESLSPREAVNQVAEQNRRWSQGSQPKDDSSAQLEGSKSFTPTRKESSVPEGRIKLSSGDGAASSQNAGVGSGQDGSGTSAVKAELAVTQEELDAASRENAELKSRLRSVEEQIETMEKLVQISSEEMRALELAAQRANEPQPEVEQTQPEVESETTKTAAEAAPEPKPAAPVQTAPAQKTWLDLAKENILYISIALGLLIAGLALFLYLRGGNEDFDDEFDDDFSVDYDSEYEPSMDTVAEEEENELLAAASEDESESDTYTPVAVSSEAETEDVVGESDIHIAYGQYELAEEKLSRALEKEPANVAMRLKLLEVFAAQADLSSFDNHFAKVHALGDQEAIDRATLLRDTIDDAEPFNLSEQDTSHFLQILNGQADGSDTQIANYDNESSEAELDVGADTLDFDFDPADTLVDSDGQSESIEFGATDEKADDTVIQNRDRPEESMPGLDLDFDLPEGEADQAPLAADRDSSANDLHQQIESSLESFDESLDLEGGDFNENDFSIDGLDEGAEDGALGDLDFDLDDSGLDLSFDDVELDLESEGLETGNEDTLISPSESVFDLPEGDASERIVQDTPDSESEIRLDEETAGATDGYGFGDSESSFAEDEALADDFDLDRELESAIGDSADDASDDTLPVDPSDEFAGLASGLDDLDFGDLDDLDIDDAQIDGGEAAEFDLAETEDLANNLAGEPLSGDADEDSPEAITETLSQAREGLQEDDSDFDATFDLDGDFELDDLDKELDSLTSGFEDSLGSADALMDEPITDFDDFNSDTSESVEPSADLEPSAESEPSADVKPSAAAEPSADTAQPAPEGLSEDAFTDGNDLDFDIPDFDPENDDDSNLDFLSDNDETATKLDLARAYIDMGDADGAKDILDEIAEEGDDQQKLEAETLLSRLA